MKKNEHVFGVCSGYTSDGHGVVKIDGFPLFVKGMMDKESGELVVTLVKKSYGFARLLKLDKVNEERVNPACPIAKQCGGCQLQHMSYKEQLAFKKQKVQDVIERIAKLNVQVEDVLGMAQPDHYRNKGQIPVGVVKGQVVTGFYRINSNTIIDTDSCGIQSEKINAVLQTMRSLFKKYGNAGVFRHLLIKHAFVTGEVMVVWIVRQKKFAHREEMVQELVQTIPEIKSVVLNLNTREDNVILGKQEEVLYGESFITDEINGLKFHISAKSFYQVNPVQTKVLYGKALEFCNLKGNETVIDLYCGVGTISMFLAQKAGKVIGIEIVEQAVRDARENAALNGLDNVKFVCSDAAAYAKKMSEQGGRADVVVVDPPRKGCDQVTLGSIVQMAPERLVYVSCDPATLVRDLRILEGKGYRVEVVQPVDMFPWTHHVETVVLLSQQKPDDTIEIDLDLDELDATSAELKATYQEIKDYVLKEFGLKVSNLYISQIKRKCGIEVGENYNLPKTENPKVPQCPKEKEEAIKAALKYFAMI